MTALGAVGAWHRPNEVRAEQLEVDDGAQPLEVIALDRELLQALIQIKEPRLTPHPPLPLNTGAIESYRLPNREVFGGVQLSGAPGELHMSGHAIHIKLDGRSYSGTYAVNRKNLTVTTSYASKTVEVSPKVQHQALAHQLLEEMVKAEKARKGSTL